ncbi:hypothetical protein IMZ48_20435, partial [Candidatus Bathyarchaeota archaeon]|nr:hypothetical protein [Candidatus Bathyarchaeota archaeon]
MTYEDIRALRNDWLTDNVRELPPQAEPDPRLTLLSRTLPFGKSQSPPSHRPRPKPPPTHRDQQLTPPRFLEREILPRYPQANIVLLRPSMTFLLMKTPDTASIRTALPDFTTETHIFLPVNDARYVNEAEG